MEARRHAQARAHRDAPTLLSARRQEQRAEKEDCQRVRRVASAVARCVREFWTPDIREGR